MTAAPELLVDQTGHPVIWHKLIDIEAPELSPKWFDAFWFGRTIRFLAFGYRRMHDREAPHYFCTRDGLPFHTDIFIKRYSLQIQLINQGWITHGVHDDITAMPIFAPGLAVILDTHSPHAVSRDPRLPFIGPNKLTIRMDSNTRPDPERMLPALLEHLRERPPHA